MTGRTLDFVALGVLIFVVLTLVYGIIYIHDIPYEIAKKRKHPHQDAIHTAGWISLFLMHTIWPFLWIWATLYKPGYGWGFHSDGQASDAARTAGAGVRGDAVLTHLTDFENEWAARQKAAEKEIVDLSARLAQLEQQLKQGEDK